MAKEKKSEGLENQIINQAVQGGIKTLIKNHPRFEKFQDYLVKHIDEGKIGEKFQDLYEQAKGKKIKDKEQFYQFLYKELREYVGSGSVLDEKGKEVILGKGIEERKPNFLEKVLEPFGYKRKDSGEKYLNNTMEAFQDLYSLFKSGDYSKRMPELTKSVSTLYDLNFLDPAVDILKANGMIDDKKYKFLKNNIYKQIGKESENVVKGIEKYIVPQKIAASILGILGLTMIMSSVVMTGAVIETSAKMTNNIVGGISILVSLLLLSVKKKKVYIAK